MIITPSPMNILDYCNDLIAGKIKVDSNYQRTDKVWPDQAKKYLIESILLGYPIPKFFLHQKIDAKSKSAVKFIVDGQQRSKAIIEYFENKFSVSRKCKYQEIAGKTFDALSEDYQNNFLSYSLPIDLFVTASREEIIETFRRMNSYTVPLNNEEKRHAHHQGEMKWFIHGLATKYSDRLANIGVFTEKNLARMADYKFYTEITCFIDRNEIITTTAPTLNEIYTRNDKVFANADNYAEKFDRSLSPLLEFDWIKDLNVKSTPIFQMIVTCLIFNEDKQLRPVDEIKQNLSALSEALETGESEEYKEFLTAASKTTNDGARRRKIYEYVKKAFFE